VGTNRRYAEKLHVDSIARMLQRLPGPLELPVQAYGPNPIEWHHGRIPVWVWCSFPDRPAERLPGYVKGQNDRIVVVWVDGPGGGWERAVWRNAVTHREHEKAPGQRP
jgi:hypothetical protein